MTVLPSKSAWRRIGEAVRRVEGSPAVLTRTPKRERSRFARGVAAHNDDAEAAPAIGAVARIKGVQADGTLEIERPGGAASDVLAICLGPIAAGETGAAVVPFGRFPLLADDYAGLLPGDAVGAQGNSWYAGEDAGGSFTVVGAFPAGEQPSGLPSGVGLVWAVAAQAAPPEAESDIWGKYFASIRPHGDWRWTQIVSDMDCSGGVVVAAFAQMVVGHEYEEGYWTEQVAGACSCPDEEEVYDLDVVIDVRCNPSGGNVNLQWAVETVKVFAYDEEYEEPLFETSAAATGPELSETAEGYDHGEMVTVVTGFAVHSGCVWVRRRDAWVADKRSPVTAAIMECDCCSPAECLDCEEMPTTITVKFEGFEGNFAGLNGTHEVPWNQAENCGDCNYADDGFNTQHPSPGAPLTKCISWSHFGTESNRWSVCFRGDPSGFQCFRTAVDTSLVCVPWNGVYTHDTTGEPMAGSVEVLEP